jgi:hypothetical protein
VRPEIKHSGSSFDAQSVAAQTKEAFIAKEEKVHFQSLTEEKRRIKLAEVWQQATDLVKASKAPEAAKPTKPEPNKPARAATDAEGKE